MLTLRNAAYAVRHAPGLDRLDFVWDALRTPYQRWIATGERRVGGVPVVIPSEFATTSWESVERKAMRHYADWIQRHPTATVFDIGCAHGIYSLVALTAGRGRVIAVDADVPSLNTTHRMCSASDRLCLIHGLIGKHDTTDESLADTSARTRTLMRTHLDPVARYVCIGDAGTETIPYRTLDRLGSEITGDILLKIDIEGAEGLALAGARQLLNRGATVLLSLHPEFVPRYGSTALHVLGMLESHGYRLTRIARDHEEHWWCHR